MQNPVTLETLFDELVALRAVVAAIPGAIAERISKEGSARPPFGGARPESQRSEDRSIPQPARLVAKPGDVEVHFGKNKGNRLISLSPKSLSWYAGEWEPRPKNNGGLWENDANLQDAARQLWHEGKNTLQGTPPASAPAPEGAAKPAVTENLDEGVPF